MINVDSSAQALTLAQENAALNGCQPQEMVVGDVFQVLRRYRDESREFDVVVLDPPKFAVSQAQLVGATRGYKDINMLALQLLRPWSPFPVRAASPPTCFRRLSLAPAWMPAARRRSWSTCIRAPITRCC